MDNKNILIVIILASMSLTFIIVGIVGVYKYDPTVLGFPPNPQDTIKVDTVTVEPVVAITKAKLSEFENEIQAKNKLLVEKDSLLNEAKKLLDSIEAVRKAILSVQDSLSKTQLSYAEQSKTISSLNDSLSRLERNYKGALDKVEVNKKTIENMNSFIEKKQDTLEGKNFDSFAKLYNNAEPKGVAKILEQIDERDAAKILKLMQKKKAGKVLEAMKPENAAAILLLGASEK